MGTGHVGLVRAPERLPLRPDVDGRRRLPLHDAQARAHLRPELLERHVHAALQAEDRPEISKAAAAPETEEAVLRGLPAQLAEEAPPVGTE